jgi:hypothetical protein
MWATQLLVMMIELRLVSQNILSSRLRAFAQPGSGCLCPVSYLSSYMVPHGFEIACNVIVLNHIIVLMVSHGSELLYVTVAAAASF